MSTSTPVKTPPVKELFAEEGLLRQLAGALHEGKLGRLHAKLQSLCSALACGTPGHAKRIDSLLAQSCGVATSLNCDEVLLCAAGRQLIPSET